MVTGKGSLDSSVISKNTRGSGEILLQYVLPVGAQAQSGPNNQIDIYWEGNKPLIQINQTVNWHDRLLIRRK
jgi:hypothetical protein